MKIQGWDMKPLVPKGWLEEEGGPLSEDIHANLVVAVKDGKRVVLHRIVKTNPDGSEEVLIIKASPKILNTDH
jgi:hypothetical protein